MSNVNDKEGIARRRAASTSSSSSSSSGSVSIMSDVSPDHMVQGCILPCSSPDHGQAANAVSPRGLSEERGSKKCKRRKQVVVVSRGLQGSGKSSSVGACGTSRWGIRHYHADRRSTAEGDMVESG